MSKIYSFFSENVSLFFPSPIEWVHICLTHFSWFYYYRLLYYPYNRLQFQFQCWASDAEVLKDPSYLETYMYAWCNYRNRMILIWQLQNKGVHYNHLLSYDVVVAFSLESKIHFTHKWKNEKIYTFVNMCADRQIKITIKQKKIITIRRWLFNNLQYLLNYLPSAFFDLSQKTEQKCVVCRCTSK